MLTNYQFLLKFLAVLCNGKLYLILKPTIIVDI